MYKLTIDRTPVYRGKDKHEIPPIAEELLLFDSFRERKSQCFFNDVSHVWHIDHMPWQILVPRLVGQHKLNAIAGF